MLVGFAFGAAGMALSTYMRGWQDFDVMFAVQFTLFLFSGTFFAVEQLPEALRPVVWVTPLWHGVDLCRSLSLGTATWPRSLVHVGYLVALGTLGYLLARRTYRRSLHP